MNETGAALRPGEVHNIVDALTMMSRAMVGLSMRNLEEVDPSMTVRQFRTLVTLVSGPMRVSDLARSLKVRSSTMTRMCDRLVRKGLVARHERVDDRRVAWVGLTEAGRVLTGRGMSHRQAEIAALVASVGYPGQSAVEFIEAFCLESGELTNVDWWNRWAELENRTDQPDSP
jgi:DNA-binding MarR family transcriptional regulator